MMMWETKCDTDVQIFLRWSVGKEDGGRLHVVRPRGFAGPAWMQFHPVTPRAWSYELFFLLRAWRRLVCFTLFSLAMSV